MKVTALALCAASVMGAIAPPTLDNAETLEFLKDLHSAVRTYNELNELAPPLSPSDVDDILRGKPVFLGLLAKYFADVLALHLEGGLAALISMGELEGVRWEEFDAILWPTASAARMSTKRFKDKTADWDEQMRFSYEEPLDASLATCDSECGTLCTVVVPTECLSTGCDCAALASKSCDVILDPTACNAGVQAMVTAITPSTQPAEYFLTRIASFGRLQCGRTMSQLAPTCRARFSAINGAACANRTVAEQVSGIRIIPHWGPVMWGSLPSLG